VVFRRRIRARSARFRWQQADPIPTGPLRYAPIPTAPSSIKPLRSVRLRPSRFGQSMLADVAKYLERGTAGLSLDPRFREREIVGASTKSPKNDLPATSTTKSCCNRQRGEGSVGMACGGCDEFGAKFLGVAHARVPVHSTRGSERHPKKTKPVWFQRRATEARG
jgi:hypothetical protein